MNDLNPVRPIFVLYVPGLDRRRVSAADTPFLDQLLKSYPSVGLRTHPTTELFPTLIAGVDPHEHEIWQVRLNEQAKSDGWRDRLPDWLTTTAQCFRHVWDSSYDLPAIPWRRRRRLVLHRLKYTRRGKDPAVLATLGGYRTIFGVLGEKSRYRISTKFGAIPRLISEIPDRRFDFDLLEFYAFDLLSHWNLDRPQVMAKHLRLVDDFARAVSERCERAGVRMILLVDHGQEAVRHTIDLRALLRASGVAASDVLDYVEVGVARFWFANDTARNAVRKALAKDPRIHLQTPADLREYGLEFPDGRFGELYAIADSGSIFFPHDFYHPLANLYMGLTKPRLWRRILWPVHRGSHGHRPDHPAEEGYVVLLDPHSEADRPWARLVDFAPTVLSLLAQHPPDSMKGTPFFRIRAAS
ncbi:MAG TPA: hypothetical protein VFR10_02755 [bacterium]|nr:hypothetical protein [bacterium]